MFKTKLIILSLTIILIGSETNAQRIKNKNVTLTYNQLPEVPLQATFTTYSASIRTRYDALSKSGFTPNSLVEKYFKLRAFKMLPTGGHFHINATVDRFTIESSDTKSTETTVKDKEGNTKKVKTYYREVIYRMPVTMTLESMDGNVLEEVLYNSPGDGLKYDFLDRNGLKFGSTTQMNEAWKKGTSTYNKLRKEAIEKAFAEFSKLVKDKYDTQVATASVQLKLPVGKKVPGADQFEANTTKAIEILKTIKADAPVDPAKENMQPILAFWEEQKDNFSAANKKEVKVHHACLVNLAIVNLYLDNFSDAQKYAEAALATNEKKLLTNTLLENINKMQSKVQAQGLSTLHFPIDLSAATGPERSDYSHLSEFEKVVKAPIVDRSTRYEGYYITTSGDSLRGTYVFRDGKDQTPRFYTGGNVKFHFDKDGEAVEWYISPEKFTRGYFNGRQFTVIRKKAGVSLKKFSFAAETIQDGPKMKLLKAFPMETKKDNGKIDEQTLIKINGQDDFINVGNVTATRFINWRKGFADLFQDCEVLYAEIRVGEYKRDLGSIADAIRVYNENSCE